MTGSGRPGPIVREQGSRRISAFSVTLPYRCRTPERAVATFWFAAISRGCGSFATVPSPSSDTGTRLGLSRPVGPRAFLPRRLFRIGAMAEPEPELDDD